MIVSRAIFVLTVVISSSTLVDGLYSKYDSVTELTSATFESKVLKSSGLWFVEFYAPWCGHCKNLAPEWKKAAKALDGVVHIAAIDADQYKDIGGRFGVQGFPTIKVFGADKQRPFDYQGQRTAKAIVDAGISEAKTLVRSRLQGGSSSSSGKKKKDKKSSSVVTLNDYNFDESIYGSDDLWLVEFYAPWCGHCKQLAPEWEKAANDLQDSGVRLAALDATTHKVKAGEFGIQGFPTIKVFAPGSSSTSDAKDYPGGRTAPDIVQYALQTVEALGGRKLHILELVDQPAFENHCVSRDASICILAFLPHIIDSTAQGRNTLLQEFHDGAKASKPTANVRFGWVQAGDQEAIEEAFGLTFGFPVVVGINVHKQRFALQRGAFQAKPIQTFLRGLMTGKTSTQQLDGTLPTFQRVTPWDGQDAVPVSSDDDDDDDMADILSELLNEEL